MKKIEKEAFSTCQELEVITLPVGVAKIGDYAFDECTKIKTINVPAKKAEYYKQRLPKELHAFVVEVAPEKKAKK